jgi:cytochrome b pre-mRNA-processing protein 3
MGLLARFFGRADEAPMSTLYEAVVARARQPHWYLAGQVPDTIDGRFDMVAAVLAILLLRMEGDPEGPAPSATLAERFVDDMDSQLRQEGIGDVGVGKHIGKMMSMLGGRLGAYRIGLADGDLGEALVRNLYRGDAPTPEAVRHVADSLRALRDSLARVSVASLVAGELPA